jgi:hypothetical protein
MAMPFRPINRQHVAALVRKLAYSHATAERTAELLVALRKYNPRDVAALFKEASPKIEPATRTISLDEIVRDCCSEPKSLFELAALCEALQIRARRNQAASRPRQQLRQLGDIGRTAKAGGAKAGE